MLRSVLRSPVLRCTGVRWAGNTLNNETPADHGTPTPGSQWHAETIRQPIYGLGTTPGATEDSDLPPYLTPKVRVTSSLLNTENFESDYRRPYTDVYGKRVAHYLIATPTKALSLNLFRAALGIFAVQLGPTEQQQAMSNIEVDISGVEEGSTITVTWRGKPVFIKHRSGKEIELARETPMSELRDPKTDESRCPIPEWGVFEAICTHLGCIPIAGEGMFKAFFCPCHGSHYDWAGRIRKGPAPANLRSVPHKMLDDTTMFLGD